MLDLFKIKKKILVLFFIFLLSPSFIFAFSDTIDLQGIFSNNTDGSKLNETLDINITLFNVSTGNIIYSEVKSINVVNGTFNYIIGTKTGLKKDYFRWDLQYQLKIKNETLNKANFSKAPVSFYADISNNTFYLEGQPGSYYLDDTDTFNSTADIKAAGFNFTTELETYFDGLYFELTDKVFNTSPEIFTVVNNGSFVSTGTKLGNSTAELLTAGFNLTTDIKAWVNANDDAGGNSTADIKAAGFNFTTELDNRYYELTDKVFNTSPEIRATFSSSANISILNGVITFNMTCEQITGSADLCDGDDAAGGGGGAGDKWIDNGTFISPNSTFADNVFIQGWINASDWTRVRITESQITDLSHTTDTFNSTADIKAAGFNFTTELETYFDGLYFELTDKVFNTSPEIFTVVNNGSFVSTGTKLGNTTAEIQAVAVGGEASGTIGSITLDHDALDDQYYDSEADLTALLDDNYLDINTVYVGSNESIQITESQISDLSPHTNLTEDDVEGYIFDSDNTANLDMNDYNVTNINTIKIQGNNVTIITSAITWHLDYNGSGVIWWE